MATTTSVGAAPHQVGGSTGMTPIAATLTRDRHAKALVVLNGGLFNGVEIYPADLRRMALDLFAVADTAAKLPTGGKNWQPITVTLTDQERGAL